MRKLIAALAAALACAAGAAAHAQNSPAAQRVLEQARAATGGAGWNGFRGVHETGKQDGVRYEAWYDPLRYGARVETHEPAGKHVHGFNGGGDWHILADGRLTGRHDPATLAQARADAYFGVYGFFFPGRFDARSAYVGVRQSQGRTFDVVRTKPWGGEPRELWFDRRTHLLTRMVDAAGPQPTTVELSDYRRVGPVRMAFRFTSYGGGQAKPRVRQIESIDFPPADRSRFSLPRPAAAP